MFCAVGEHGGGGGAGRHTGVARERAVGARPSQLRNITGRDAIRITAAPN